MGPITSFAVAVLLVATPATLSQSIHVHAEGTTALNLETGAFEGDVTFHLDGVPSIVASSASLLEQTVLPNGTLLLKTTHTFDFGGGDVLVTRDQQRHVPTATPGLYELHAQFIIIGGQGIFEGAGGALRSQSGSVDYNTFEATVILLGVLTLQP